jgi:threonine/homoserine/homoserine lactone efflux protein
VVTLGALAGVAVASAVLVAVPGPAVLFVVGRALAAGRPAALASVLGNCCGSYAAAIAVAISLGSLLQRSTVVLVTVRFSGAAFLIWLGLNAISRSHTQLATLPGTRTHGFGLRSIRIGFLVGISNPKSFIVFAVLVPPFVRSTGDGVPTQMLMLSVVPVAIGAVTDSAWALGASAARGWFATSANRLAAVQRAGGAAIVLLGIVTALGGIRR